MLHETWVCWLHCRCSKWGLAMYSQLISTFWPVVNLGMPLSASERNFLDERREINFPVGTQGWIFRMELELTTVWKSNSRRFSSKAMTSPSLITFVFLNTRWQLYYLWRDKFFITSNTAKTMSYTIFCMYGYLWSPRMNPVRAWNKWYFFLLVLKL